ncbi:MAG TPA: helix-turn-helix domain-containing protein [Abditibacteriaceae bacterium]|jgi:excisionase family DNA binding protein
MTESRIQDWIRYVQERAENVPPDEKTETTATETVQRSVHNTPLPVPPGPTADPQTEQDAAEQGAAKQEAAQTAPTPVAPRRLSSAAVARAGSRIKRVAAASGRNFAPAETSATRSAPDPSIVAAPGRVQVDDTSVLASVMNAPARATSTREAIAARPSETLPIPDVMSIAGVVAVDGVTPARQRVRQRPETRTQMLERLTNPTISLYEASVLLDVCSATVRRYTNSGVLPHVRTEGGQRRFRLHDVLVLMRDMEAAKKQ